MGAGARANVQINDAHGTEREFPTNEMGNAAARLRKVMYQENTCTWYSMTLTVRPDGTGYDVDYTYTTEPEWGLLSPEDEDYRKDLYMFPRTPEHIPDWFAPRLALSDWEPTPETPDPEDYRSVA